MQVIKQYSSTLPYII